MSRISSSQHASTSVTTAGCEPVDNLMRIPTPAMVIDLAVVEDNVRRMADYARKHNLQLRPHTKTHKLQLMAQMQLNHGAVGLTVAKVGEAEVMRNVCDDLLIAYPALDPYRATRTAQLAREAAVRVAIDSIQAADALAQAAQQHNATLGILVELDAGFERTGVQTAEQSLAIAQHVERARNLRLDGICFYPGHVRGDPEMVIADMVKIEHFLQEVIATWKRAGLQPTVVSGGSTPSAPYSHHTPSQTEIRPGTYIFNDVNSVACGVCTEAQCAATIVATVVSNAVPGKVVVDAGSKSLTPERHTFNPAFEGLGRVVGLPEARIVRVSEEHGEIDITACSRQPALGERLHIIPVHVCPAVNLHTTVWLKHHDTHYEPVPIDARGLVC